MTAKPDLSARLREQVIANLRSLERVFRSEFDQLSEDGRHGGAKLKGIRADELAEAADLIDSLLSDLDTARTRIAEAVGVMEPFAEIAKALDYWAPVMPPEMKNFPIGGLDEQPFRAASSWLQSVKEEKL